MKTYTSTISGLREMQADCSSIPWQDREEFHGQWKKLAQALFTKADSFVLAWEVYLLMPARIVSEWAMTRLMGLADSLDERELVIERLAGYVYIKKNPQDGWQKLYDQAVNAWADYFPGITTCEAERARLEKIMSRYGTFGHPVRSLYQRRIIAYLSRPSPRPSSGNSDEGPPPSGLAPVPGGGGSPHLSGGSAMQTPLPLRENTGTGS